MGYSQKTKGGKTYTKKKSSGKRDWSSYLGKGAYNLITDVGVSYLKKQLGLNTENKNYDLSGTQAITGACAPWLSPVASLAQGTTDFTRNGNSLRVTHYSIKGSIKNDTLNSIAQQVRVIAVYQPTLSTAGTVITPAQLLQSTTNIDSPYNSDLSGAKIVFDKTFILTPNYSGQVVVQKFRFKWSPSYKDGQVAWTDADTTGLVSNLIRGNLRLYIFDDQTGNHPSVQYFSRVHFVDN